jgi:conjugative relaxase-like TrwC/TraI family protein
MRRQREPLLGQHPDPDANLRETETCAASRVRQGGANENRTSGNLVLAVYHHDTSRELDPQLHTHAVAANLTFDGAECRWKALQAPDIYERRRGSILCCCLAWPPKRHPRP